MSFWMSFWAFVVSEQVVERVDSFKNANLSEKIDGANTATELEAIE